MQLDDYGIMFDLNEGRFPSAFRQKLIAHEDGFCNRISLSQLSLAIPNLELICYQYKGYLGKNIKPMVPNMYIGNAWTTKPVFDVYFDLMPKPALAPAGGYVNLLKKQEEWLMYLSHEASIQIPLKIGDPFHTSFGTTKREQ
jgi:hypothetical protein